MGDIEIFVVGNYAHRHLNFEDSIGGHVHNPSARAHDLFKMFQLRNVYWRDSPISEEPTIIIIGSGKSEIELNAPVNTKV